MHFTTEINTTQTFLTNRIKKNLMRKLNNLFLEIAFINTTYLKCIAYLEQRSIMQIYFEYYVMSRYKYSI